MVNIDKKFQKLFLEEKKSAYYKTIGLAKSDIDSPRICRIWRNEKMYYTELVWAFGCSVCTIKQADDKIRERAIRDMQMGRIIF